MEKRYTTPGIVKVELKPEQAVLGQCSTSSLGNLKTGGAYECSSAAGGCRRYVRGGDTAGNS